MPLPSLPFCSSSPALPSLIFAVANHHHHRRRHVSSSNGKQQQMPASFHPLLLPLCATIYILLGMLAQHCTASSAVAPPLNCLLIRPTAVVDDAEGNNGNNGKLLDLVQAVHQANIGTFGVRNRGGANGKENTENANEEEEENDDDDMLAKISPVSEMFNAYMAEQQQQQQCPSNSSYCILLKCKAIGGTLQDCFEPAPGLSAQNACNWIVNQCQQHTPEAHAYCRACAHHPQGECTADGMEVPGRGEVPEQQQEDEGGKNEEGNNNANANSIPPSSVNDALNRSAAIIIAAAVVVLVLVPMVEMVPTF